MTDVQVLTPREVPLGGLRAMTVRRTLPAGNAALSGRGARRPLRPRRGGHDRGMDVAPHPHCGLATVSWLFMGRSSTGTPSVPRRWSGGEVNLMTAGRGIAHSGSRRTPRRCFVACNSGRRCRTRCATLRRPSSITCRRWVSPAAGVGGGLRRLALRVALAGRDRHTAAGGRGGARSRRLGDLDSPRDFEVADASRHRHGTRDVCPAANSPSVTSPSWSGHAAYALEGGGRRVGRAWSCSGGPALPGGGRDVVELRGSQP